ncbi:hypothetical protein D3C75_1176610 [compost metagenome]
MPGIITKKGMHQSTVLIRDGQNSLRTRSRAIRCRAGSPSASSFCPGSVIQSRAFFRLPAFNRPSDGPSG